MSGWDIAVVVGTVAGVVWFVRLCIETERSAPRPKVTRGKVSEALDEIAVKAGERVRAEMQEEGR